MLTLAGESNSLGLSRCLAQSLWIPVWLFQGVTQSTFSNNESKRGLLHQRILLAPAAESRVTVMMTSVDVVHERLSLLRAFYNP